MVDELDVHESDIKKAKEHREERESEREKQREIAKAKIRALESRKNFRAELASRIAVAMATNPNYEAAAIVERSINIVDVIIEHLDRSIEREKEEILASIED
jgi:hypothetical protein